MEKGPEDETAEDDCDVGFHLQRKVRNQLDLFLFSNL